MPGTEYRKEYGCSGNVERFPLTEDHNSEGKESGTGYADFEVQVVTDGTM